MVENPAHHIAFFTFTSSWSHMAVSDDGESRLDPITNAAVLLPPTNDEILRSNSLHHFKLVETAWAEWMVSAAAVFNVELTRIILLCNLLYRVSPSPPASHVDRPFGCCPGQFVETTDEDLALAWRLADYLALGTNVTSLIVRECVRRELRTSAFVSVALDGLAEQQRAVGNAIRDLCRAVIRQLRHAPSHVLLGMDPRYSTSSFLVGMQELPIGDKVIVREGAQGDELSDAQVRSNPSALRNVRLMYGLLFAGRSDAAQ